MRVGVLGGASLHPGRTPGSHDPKPSDGPWPAGEPVVYLVCEPSTRYYRVMTRADWMPVLIDEVI